MRYETIVQTIYHFNTGPIPFAGMHDQSNRCCREKDIDVDKLGDIHKTKGSIVHHTLANFTSANN